MRIELPSGLVIQCSPVFPWERRACDLKIDCSSVFHPRHVTSRLCLELLDAALPTSACRLFLDVGCGSGILALAALRLGASTAVGVDIDPRAIRVSRSNAMRNKLSERAHWIAGPSSAIRGRFDCVAANLPYTILQRLLPELASGVQASGSMVVSGFQDVQAHSIRILLIENGFVIDRTTRGDFSFPELPPAFSHTWVAMMGRKILNIPTRS